MGKIKIDPTKLNKAINQAFDKTVDYQDEIFKQQFTDVAYQWPRYTRRHNGSIAGLVRDIVDTGALADSQTLARSSSVKCAGESTLPGTLDDLSVEWSWTMPYAAIVLLGATLRNGTVLPARDWILRGLLVGNPVDKFTNELRRRL